MADRVKYFLLGLLFLVVAGVIAYDKWNSTVSDPSADEARASGAGATATVVAAPVTESPPVQEDPQARSLAVPQTSPQLQPEVAETQPLATAPVVRREPLPAQLPPRPAPRAEPRTHTVQGGESLEAIALRYYGTRTGVEWIAEANGIRDPNRIRVNQKLVIPARAETASAGAAPSSATPARSAKATTIPAVHVVKAGDGDLYAICRRYYGTGGEGARVARIMDLNDLWSAQVAPGTKIKLPPK